MTSPTEEEIVARAIKYRACRVCGIEKPLSEFFPTTSGYFHRQCKRCHNDKINQSRLNDEFRLKRADYLRNTRDRPTVRATDRRKAAEYRIKYPEKAEARIILRNAIRRGEIQRPPNCEECGKPDPKRKGRAEIHAHHIDYSKPLEVRWLCVWCHHAEHFNGK